MGQSDPVVARVSDAAAIGRRGLAVGALALFLLGILLVGLHVAAYSRVSPIDETQHIDYLYKSPHIVARDERIAQDAMREVACRGLDSGFVPPACAPGAVYDPNAFPELGYNTAAINSPVYYTLTHWLAVPVQWLTGMDSLVTAARLIGGVWLGLGMAVTFLAGRRLGVPAVPLAAAAALPAAAPTVLYLSSTITPDAMTLLVGAAVVSTTLYWQDRPARRWPALAAMAALAVLIKQTNLLILAAVGVYLLLRWIGAVRARSREVGDEPRPSSWLIGLAAVAGGAGAAVVGWTIVYSRHPTPADLPMAVNSLVDVLHIDDVLAATGQLLEIPQAWGLGPGSLGLSILITRLVRIALLVGVIGAAVFASGSMARTTLPGLARGAAVAGLIGAPALIVLNYLVAHWFFVIRPVQAIRCSP